MFFYYGKGLVVAFSMVTVLIVLPFVCVGGSRCPRFKKEKKPINKSLMQANSTLWINFSLFEHGYRDITEIVDELDKAFTNADDIVRIPQSVYDEWWSFYSFPTEQECDAAIAFIKETYPFLIEDVKKPEQQMIDHWVNGIMPERKHTCGGGVEDIEGLNWNGWIEFKNCYSESNKPLDESQQRD